MAAPGTKHVVALPGPAGRRRWLVFAVMLFVLIRPHWEPGTILLAHYLVTFVFGIAGQFFAPAEGASIPSLVPTVRYLPTASRTTEARDFPSITARLSSQRISSSGMSTNVRMSAAISGRDIIV